MPWRVARGKIYVMASRIDLSPKEGNAFAQKQVKWFRLNAILSRNAAFNIIVGPRGDGKTFAAKEKAINNAIRKGEQFILLRRYKTELASRNSFFSDIAFKYPGYSFRVRGENAQMQRAGAGDKEWETIGYFVALSNSQQKKSVAYPLVTLIIFDEFIVDKGPVRYMNNEVRALLDFYSTVDRYQDRVRVIMISNTVSIMNPYFLEWGVHDIGSEWWTDDTGFVCVQFIRDDQFTRAVNETRFGKFISGTDYGDYAVGATFRDNHYNLVKRKPEDFKYLATIETKSGTFSVWWDVKTKEWYGQTKRPKGGEDIWTMIPENMCEGKTYISRNNQILNIMRAAYSKGRFFFDGPVSRNAFAGVLL